MRRPQVNDLILADVAEHETDAQRAFSRNGVQKGRPAPSRAVKGCLFGVKLSPEDKRALITFLRAL